MRINRKVWNNLGGLQSGDISGEVGQGQGQEYYLVRKDLRGLESQGNWEGIEDVRDAIANYRDIMREDFEDLEEYSKARSEAWSEVIDTLGTLVEVEE